MALTLDFTGSHGSTMRLADWELAFFTIPFSAKKIIASIFIFRKLLWNKQWRSLFLFIRGCTRFAMRLSPNLTNEEYAELLNGVIGFAPKAVEVVGQGIRVSVTSCEAIILAQVIFQNQYSLTRKNALGRVFIDAGANVGIFSLYAASMGAKKVYAFEPVKETFLQMKENIRMNGFKKTIMPVNMALGRKSGHGTISYSYSGDPCAHMISGKGVRNSHQVRIATIDGFMAGKGRTDFIKIDSEGWEEKILLGAKATLKKYKPVLSFSAYHKPSDKQTLPALVKSIRPGYSCVLHRKGEEDFYCE